MDISENTAQVLFHIGYRFPEHKLKVNRFSNIRVVILCGPPSRALKIAETISSAETPLNNLCYTDRYSLYHPEEKVLVASHGIGLGSIDCLLHDVYHLLQKAGAEGWSFIRIGSCGGIGAAPGTVVVTRNALSADLDNALTLTVLGERRHFVSRLDATLTKTLLKDAEQAFPGRCLFGDTMCAETFFDSQARMDGVDTVYSVEEKMTYLTKCFDAGVVNIEMESLPLAAFAARANVPAAVLCLVLVDRLQVETPTESNSTLAGYEHLVTEFIAKFVHSHF